MNDTKHAEIIANTDNYKYSIDVNDNGAKTFHSCDTKEKYIEVIKKSKHMYELLDSELRKPYLDFDKFCKTPDQVDGLLIEITILYNQLFNNEQITVNDLKVTYRKDAEKINIVSLHVVIDKLTYGTKEQVCDFAKRVKSSCEPTTDLGVYDKNRNFKIPNRSKYGTLKIAKIYNKYTGCPYDEVMKHHANVRDTTGFTQLQLKSDTPATVTPVINNVPTPDTKNNTLTFRDTDITYIANDDDTIDKLTPELENMGFSGIVKVSKYGFDCDQRRGDKCPLCDSTHRKNQFWIIKNKAGSYFVKSHSKKCVKTLIKGDVVFTEQEQQLIVAGESQEYIIMKKKLENDENVSKIKEQLLFSQGEPASFISREKLMHTYENWRLYDGKGGNESFIKKWLQDPHMKTYTSLDFLPGGAPPDVYNTWTDYKVKTLEKTEENVDITMFHEIIFMLTGGDIEYFTKWLARLFQKPGEKPMTACVFRSIQGCGKNSLFILIDLIMGNNIVNLVEDASQDLFGRFTDAVESRKLVVIDEAETFNNSRALKGLITNPETRCEKKGQQSYKVSNHAGFCFLTNEKNPVKVDKCDRRYFAYDSLSTYKGNEAYWLKFHTKFIVNPNVQIAVYEYLMSVNIEGTKWESERPKNQAYQELRGMALDIEIKFLSHFIVEGFPPSTNKITAENLFGNFLDFTTGSKYEYTKLSFGRKLADLLKKGEVFSENDQPKKAFHRTRGAFGMTWLINRQKAFDWLKSENYTDVNELHEITSGSNYNYNNTL
jgi:hypothetical protein